MKIMIQYGLHDELMLVEYAAQQIYPLESEKMQLKKIIMTPTFGLKQISSDYKKTSDCSRTMVKS